MKIWLFCFCFVSTSNLIFANSANWLSPPSKFDRRARKRRMKTKQNVCCFSCFCRLILFPWKYHQFETYWSGWSHAGFQLSGRIFIFEVFAIHFESIQSKTHTFMQTVTREIIWKSFAFSVKCKNKHVILMKLLCDGNFVVYSFNFCFSSPLFSLIFFFVQTEQ